MPDKMADIDSTRRTLLATVAAAATAAAAQRALGQTTESNDQANTAFFERGDVRIRYHDTGSGFPLLLIPGGGLNSAIANLARSPFDVVGEFQGEYRCITLDLRNSNNGQSIGPLDIDRPWDAFTDDQLALMDHLGIEPLAASRLA